MISGINVIIGVDVFTVDFNVYSYFQEIVDCLDKNSLNNGLDVSNVGGFDEEVFNRLDESYIHDLKDVMSNCSEGSPMEAEHLNTQPSPQEPTSQ